MKLFETDVGKLYQVLNKTTMFWTNAVNNERKKNHRNYIMNLMLLTVSISPSLMLFAIKFLLMCSGNNSTLKCITKTMKKQEISKISTN